MLKVNSLHFKRRINSREKKDKRPKKTNVAWDNNEISSFSDEDHASKALMASDHSSDEEHEVSDYEIDDRPSYGELQSAFNGLHDEFLKLSRKLLI